MPAPRKSSSLAASSKLRSGGEPNAASSLAHIERAAATLTCCPTMVLNKVGAPGSLLAARDAVGFDHPREGRLAARERVDCGADALAGPDHQPMLAA